MQRFLIQIPGEFTAIEAGALAAKLQELNINVFLVDAEQQAAHETPKKRKSSETCASVQWSKDPALYARQRTAVAYVLSKMRPGPIYTPVEIERWVRDQGHYHSVTPVVTLACRDGYLERPSRGKYVLTEKGADFARARLVS